MPFEKLKAMPLAFDADGVILDFVKAFKQAGTEALGRELDGSSPSYSLCVKFGITEDELGKVWESFNASYWHRLEALEGAIEAIDSLQAAGFRNLHVVTAIPDQFRADRHANFESLGFSPEMIHCVLHVSRFSKVPPIMALKPLFFVDDRIEHLHSNPQVPLLVHVDYKDEQFPAHDGRVDATVPSLSKWAKDFLAQPEYWEEVAFKNNSMLADGFPAPLQAAPARRRGPK